MSYTKSKEARVITLTVPGVISANSTVQGPGPNFAGEIVKAEIWSPSDHTADDNSNNFVITVRANGNTALTLNTAVTDINASINTFPTLTSTIASRRFTDSERITVVFTETGTAVNFPANTLLFVHVIPVYDHGNE